MVIHITMKNGHQAFYGFTRDYTSYEVNWGMLIVKNGEQWVGMYNVSEIMYVEVLDYGFEKDEDEK